MKKQIESTKKVYLDGQEYIRVFFIDSEYFEDVISEDFEDWKQILECEAVNITEIELDTLVTQDGEYSEVREFGQTRVKYYAYIGGAIQAVMNGYDINKAIEVYDMFEDKLEGLQ